jgi:hypothetical protein
MPKRGFLVILAILLIAPGFITAQDLDAKPEKTIKSGVKPGKAFPVETGLMSVQVPKQDKARVVLLATSVWVYDAASDSEAMQHIIPADADLATIYVDFSAVLNTRVRFHVIFAGPEYWAEDDDDWYPAKYNTADYYEDNVYWVSILPSEWKKGTYKLVIIAEQETVGSGAESVIECIFRII